MFSNSESAFVVYETDLNEAEVIISVYGVVVA
jgi:hypothetical protein